MSEEPTNWSSWEEKMREVTNRELVERLIRERDEARAEATAYKASYETVCSAATSMAANQCHDGYGDEWGNHRCRVQDALQARVKVLEEALREIAAQKIHKEITATDPDEIDWLGGYEGCVNRARTALQEQGK
jgi:hypothetical protein